MNFKTHSIWRKLVDAFSILTWDVIHPFLQSILTVYATCPLATY